MLKICSKTKLEARNWTLKVDKLLKTLSDYSHAGPGMSSAYNNGRIHK